jgi:hypothetical protein
VLIHEDLYALFRMEKFFFTPAQLDLIIGLKSISFAEFLKVL